MLVAPALLLVKTWQRPQSRLAFLFIKAGPPEATVRASQ